MREILLELLPLAQVVGEHVSPSLRVIVSIIAKVFENVCRQVSDSLFEAGTAELLVGGFCPVANHLQLFHIRSELSGELRFTAEEKLLTTPVFIGSGAAQARKLAVGLPNRSLPSVLRQIIHDESIPAVGGPIQLAKFEGRDFTVLGIQDYEINDDVLTVHYLYRGVKVRQLLEDIGLPYAHFGTSYLAPFLHEIDQLADEGKLVKVER